MKFLVVASVATLAGLASARIDFQTEIPNGDKVVRNGDPWPAVGHLQPNTGNTSTLNSFGLAFQAAGNKWTPELCNADTDGDGYTNGAELGDPNCLWRKDGSGIAEWSSSISHPAYADSRPVGLPMVFRLHGPSPTEGILQARIFPNPWGVVALPMSFLTVDWAAHFCDLGHERNATWGARAWGAWDRPREDRQYLGADEYVSVSEPTRCVAGTQDLRQCTVRYSKLDAAQNLTNALEGGVYVNCRYAISNGTVPYTQRIRLRGSEPGSGQLDSYWPAEQKWYPVNTSMGDLNKDRTAPDFICRRLLKYVGGVSKMTIVRASSPSDSWPVRGSATMCDPFTKAEICYFNTSYKASVSVILEFECGSETNAFKDELGPATPGFTFATEKGFTQEELLTLLANRTGINATQFVVHRWQPAPVEQNLTHIAIYANLTSVAAPANPGLAFQKVKDDDSELFGIVASKIEHVPLRSIDPTGPSSIDDFEFKLLGPRPTEGVVLARLRSTAAANGTWGMVHWHEDSAWATEFCRRAGVMDPNYNGRLTVLAADSTFHQYAPVDKHVMLSDPTGCEEREQQGNASACKFVYSPPGQPRNIGSWENAAYAECRYETFPEMRLNGYYTCMGQLEIKPTRATRWDTSGTSFTKEEVCAMVGCNCTLNPSGVCSSSFVRYGTTKYFLRRCDPTNAATSCQTDVFSPIISNYGEKGYDEDSVQLYNCGIHGDDDHLNTLSRQPWLRGARIDSRIFGLPNMTRETFLSLVDNRWGLAASKPAENTSIEILQWNNTYPAQNGWMTFEFRVWGEKAYGGPSTHVHNIRTDIGYTDSITSHYWFGPRRCITAPQWAVPAGYPEFKLVGPKEGVGFVMGRLGEYVWDLGKMVYRPWGGISFNYDLTSEYARLFCKATGHFTPGLMQRAWAVYDKPAESTAFMKRTDLVTFVDVYCTRAVSSDPNEQTFVEDFVNNCTWRYNEIEGPNYYAADRAIYVDCKMRPHQWRIVGAFRGIGYPEVYLDGTWKLAYPPGMGGPWGLKPATICGRFAGFNDPNWKPTLGFSTDEKRDRGTAVYFYRCDDDMDISDCQWWFDYETGSSSFAETHVECVAPQIDTPFAQTSVLYFNGVFVRSKIGAGKSAFAGRVGAIVGLPAAKVFLSQWDDRPNEELVWVTLTLNATGINAGTALNNLAKDASMGWKETDVRPIPVYNEIEPAAWDWSVEQDRTGGPRGNLIARPSRHYAWGVPCAATWTTGLARIACKTVFNYDAPEGVPPPRFESRAVVGEDNVRNMYLDQVICDYGYAKILGNCSFAYANGPSDKCPGNANIFLDCAPVTKTISKSLIATPAPPTTTAAPNPNATTTKPPTTTGTTPPGPGTTGPPGTTTVMPPTTTGEPTTSGAPSNTTLAPVATGNESTTPAPNSSGVDAATKTKTKTIVPVQKPSRTATKSATQVLPVPYYDAAAEEKAAAIDEVLNDPLTDSGSTTGVVLGGAVGGGAALDMQGVMVLAAANCESARKTKKGGSRASNIKAVVPWRFAETPAGGVGALLATVAGVFALQAVAAVVIKLVGHRDTWWHSFARARCPSIGHAVFVVMLQGLCLETALCLIDDNPAMIAVGAAGVFAIGAGVGARMWLVADPRERMGVEPEPYEKLKEQYHPIIAAFLPAVFWHPADEDEDPDATGQFGSFTSPCREEFGPTVVMIQLLKRVSIAASVVIAASTLPCELSYVVVIVVHLVSALFTIAKRPLRKGFENFLTFAMDLFIVTIAAALWLGAPLWVLSYAMIGAAIVSFFAGVVSVLTFAMENRKWKPDELELDEKEAAELLKGGSSSAKEAPLLGIPRLESGPATGTGTDSPSAGSPRHGSVAPGGDAAATRELEAALAQLMMGGGGGGDVAAPGAAQPGGVQYLVVEEGSPMVNPLLNGNKK